jgi:anti-anti-sigma regulatory factor
MNLKSVDSLEPMAAGILLKGATDLREHDGDLKLCGMGLLVKQTLRFAGMQETFENYLSLDDAIAGFDDEWSGAVAC